MRKLLTLLSLLPSLALGGGTANLQLSYGGAQQDFATWDSATHNANIVLSAGDLTATRQSTDEGVFASLLATIGKSSGKWYWEYTLDDGGQLGFMLGLSQTGLSQTTYPGSNATSYGYQSQTSPPAAITTGILWTNASSVLTSDTYTGGIPGIVIGVALNMDDGLLFLSINNGWISNGTGTGNPVTGANPAFSGLSGTQLPAVALYYNTAAGGLQSIPEPVLTADFGVAPTYAPPAGYNAGLYN